MVAAEAQIIGLRFRFHRPRSEGIDSEGGLAAVQGRWLSRHG